MTEKRFTLTFDDKIVDNLTGITHNVHSGYDVAMDLSGLLNELNDECEFLEIENEALEDGATKYAELYHKSLKENEQLKQRNNRQAKQLDRLYNLIEEKDWRTLSDIIDDFKRCEEQLQREWKCYE